MRIPLFLIWLSFSLLTFAQEKMANVEVDLNKEMGELEPIWAWFGYDEPNYTYTTESNFRTKKGA